jgi:hypothetical protein
LPPNPDNTDPNAPRPQGNGWAIAKIDAAGKVKVTGELADGTKLGLKGTLAKDGTFDAFARPYKKKLGVFAGTFAFAAPPRDPSPAVSDVTGTVVWTKPAESSGPFPAAFATQLDLVGSAYVAPAKGARALPGLDAAGAARLLFHGGGLPADAVKDVVISTQNKVTYPNPTGPLDKLTLGIKAKTGALQGKFFHDGSAALTPFGGVILQKQQEGAGTFVGAHDSGTVDLTARP